jgi:4'-phosphopantetheinyl transferase
VTDVIALAPSEVHVWCGTTPDDQAVEPSTWNLLSSEERAEADRLRDASDRLLRVHARATLRRLLAHYVGTDPKDLDFERNQHGKPALTARSGGGRLRFNISHSETKILIAVSADRDVGVDVERIQPDFPWEEVARSLLAPVEITTIGGVPEDRRVQAFFDCWVRKEAYLKGWGTGLSASLHDFVVPLGPSGGAVHDDPGSPTAASHWRVHSLDVGSGYAAALAVAGEAQVIRRHFSDRVAYPRL